MNLTMQTFSWSKPLIFARLLAVAATAIAGEDTNRVLFGFAGPEIFPLENGIAHLRVGDLDGDGRPDLVLANNARSKLNLLFNRTGQTNASPAPKLSPTDLNDLPPDARFRLDSIASEKRISALALADLNGDERPDLAYYGEPKELVVLYHQGSNSWSAPKRWPLEDGQLNPNALTTGDLNGDGRTDLLLLGETALYLLAQRADHTLSEPEKVPFTGTIKSVQVLDIDGNDRDDLLLVNWENPNPFRFRLQNDAGKLGPEIHFSMIPLRSYWAEDLDGDRRTEVITIAMSSGRAQIGNFKPKPAEQLAGDFRQGQFQVLPLNRTSKSRRGQVWADVNGDQRTDLLVAEPDSGQVTLYLQLDDGTLGEGRTFPSLTGISEIAVAPAPPAAAPDIYLLSPDERQVGVTRFDPQGRLAFPSTVPYDGKPLALAVSAHPTNGQPVVAVLVDRDGKRHLVIRTGEAGPQTQALNDSFRSNPSRMAWHDVDHDGLEDLVVLVPYEKIKVLLQRPGADFEELDVAPPGGALEQPWLSQADVDGDGKAELLLAQKNFLRAVVLTAQGDNPAKQSWVFTVKDQINGAGSNSRIVGAAALPQGTNAVPAIFLLDAERKTLTLCQRDTNAVWQVVRNLALPVLEFDELQPVALGSQAPNSVAFLGGNAVAWMPLAGEAWDFKELDGYESPIKDGRLSDIVSGDLNQDGRKDLVFLETAQNHLDLVIFSEAGKLVPATRWKVFEERTYRGRRGSQMEPREALVADVTGDGKNDLVVVVHDRVLVYPQE